MLSLRGVSIVHPPPQPSPTGMQEGSLRSVHKSYFIVCSPPPSPLFVSAFLALSWGDAWRLWRSGEPHWEVLWSYLSHVMFPVRSNTTGVPRSSHGKPAKHFLHSTPPFLLFLSACLAIFFSFLSLCYSLWKLQHSPSLPLQRALYSHFVTKAFAVSQCRGFHDQTVSNSHSW